MPPRGARGWAGETGESWSQGRWPRGGPAALLCPQQCSCPEAWAGLPGWLGLWAPLPTSSVWDPDLRGFDGAGTEVLQGIGCRHGGRGSLRLHPYLLQGHGATKVVCPLHGVVLSALGVYRYCLCLMLINTHPSRTASKLLKFSR